MDENKQEGSVLKTIMQIGFYLVIGFVLSFGVKQFIEPTVVVGDSMYPTLKDGEYMLNYKKAYNNDEVELGDVVIVHLKDEGYPDQFLIKRVVGLPNDVIEIIEGDVHLNGELLSEEYAEDKMRHTADMKYVLNDDEVFVLGDNRNNSLDSRNFGPITLDEIRGEVVLRLMPFDQSYKN